MTAQGEQPTVEQLREDIDLLRGELAQLAGQLARLDTRTETHARALDDIEAYVTETAQLARAAADHATATASTASTNDSAKAEQGVDMRILVPWVENNITTLIARKVPTTDGAPKWCPQWWDHAEAIARLEAARQAWIALSTAGGTGLVTYFDYLDRVVLAVLTSETGPFARCGPRQHTIERPLGHTPPPPEIYEQLAPSPTPPAPAAASPVPPASEP
jgi:Domain of unknown function (DUF4913)